MTARTWIASGLLLSGLVTGCIFVTGGTDGYSAGSSATPTGSCGKTSDCPDAQVCCYELSAELPTSACAASCDTYLQACKSASDCGDGGACLSNSCTYAGESATITTCGPVPICTQ